MKLLVLLVVFIAAFAGVFVAQFHPFPPDNSDPFYKRAWSVCRQQYPTFAGMNLDAGMCYDDLSADRDVERWRVQWQIEQERTDRIRALVEKPE